MALVTTRSTALARRPAAAIVAAAAGPHLPSYVARDQARAIINAAETTLHRLLLETLWQSGGRVTEVLRLRPADLVEEEGALRLTNLKQRRRGQTRKLVYVSPELLAQLRRFATSARLRPTDAFFRSRESGTAPMSYAQCWRLIRRYAAQAGVQVVGADGRFRPPNGRDFRHGAAVHQVRQGIPHSEVQQQLGHARIDTTSIYAKLANPERRAMADRVAW
jgi:integrase/recombinase XerD